MASVVDWSLDVNTLRKELLKLSKPKLVQACKYRNVPYSINKKETIDGLLKSTEPNNSSLADRISYYEQKEANVKKSRYHKHGKHGTQFTDHELESVGLAWLKPPKLAPIPSDHDIDTDIDIVYNNNNNNNNNDHNDNNNPIIRPQTTQVASWAHYQYQETNEQDALKEELNKKIESYGTFEVMSSLLFGFAVSVAFQNVNGSHFNETQDIYHDIAEILFTVFIIIVLVCNAYTMIVLSLTYFYVHRYMADKEYIMATIYLKIYANYRKYARRSFYIGLVCFMAAIGIYLLPLLNIISKLCVLIFLGFGLVIIIFTLITMTNPSRIADRNNPGHKKFLSVFMEKGGVHEKMH